MASKSFLLLPLYLPLPLPLSTPNFRTIRFINLYQIYVQFDPAFISSIETPPEESSIHLLASPLNKSSDPLRKRNASYNEKTAEFRGQVENF